MLNGKLEHISKYKTELNKFDLIFQWCKTISNKMASQICWVLFYIY